MPRFQTPHSRYQHVFVVVRLPKDKGSSGDTSLDEGDITLTKAFLSEAAAQDEAERLNDLNQDQWGYSVNVVRLVEDS